MCLQCECVSKEIGTLGDISIQISTVDNLKWAINTIGLVKSNDPFKILKTTNYLVDACFEKDNFSNDEYNLWEKHMKCVEEFEKNQDNVCEASDGYFLIENLKKSGYDTDVHGFRYTSYLVHKIAEMLNTYDKVL